MTQSPRVRQALVVLQVAMTVILLSGAGLLVRAGRGAQSHREWLRHARSVDHGGGAAVGALHRTSAESRSIVTRLPRFVRFQG